MALTAPSGPSDYSVVHVAVRTIAAVVTVSLSVYAMSASPALVNQSEPPSPTTKALKQGVAWVYLSLIIQALSKGVVVVALTRLLDPSDFGLLGIALIFTSLAERFGSVGVGPSVVQVEGLSRDDRRTAEVLSVLSGVVVTGVLWVLAPFIAAFFRQPQVELILQVMALGFVLDGFGVVPESILQRQLLFRVLMVIENVAYVCGQLLVATCLAWSGYGVWALVVGNLSFRLIKLCGVVLYAPVGPGGGVFSFTSAKALIDRGIGFSLGRILNFFSLQGDNFVVGRVLGADALGMYTRAYQLMSLPAMYVGQVFDRVLFPAVAREQGNAVRVRQSLLGSLELVAFISLPTAVVMFICAEEVIVTLFGKRWLHIVPVVSVLSLGVFFRTAYKCADTLVKSLGAVYRHAFRQALYTTLVVVGSLIGAQLLGLTGVAWAVVLAVAVHYGVITQLAVQMTGVRWIEIAKAHLPAAWVSLWVAVSLSVLRGVPQFYTIESSLSRLCLELTISCLGALAAYRLGWPLTQGAVVPEMAKRLEASMIRLVGRAARIGSKASR